MEYPVELYRNNHYRVTFSPEEHRALAKDGWKEDKTPGQQYVSFISGIPEEIPGVDVPFKRGPGRPPKIDSEPAAS